MLTRPAPYETPSLDDFWEIIPTEQYRKAISGVDCWNNEVSPGERIFIFASLTAGGGGNNGQGLLSKAWGWLKRLLGIGENARGNTQVNPLDGVVYDKRVPEAVQGQVLNPYPDYHAFPAIVDNYAHLATVTKTVVNGKTITLINCPVPTEVEKEYSSGLSMKTTYAIIGCLDPTSEPV